MNETNCEIEHREGIKLLSASIFLLCREEICNEICWCSCYESFLFLYNLVIFISAATLEDRLLYDDVFVNYFNLFLQSKVSFILSLYKCDILNTLSKLNTQASTSP